MIIYKTTNIVNGKYYIGKSKYNREEYLGSGKILLQSIKKNGKKLFIKEILEYCETDKELNIREKYWIKKLDSTNKNKGYNIQLGGQGGCTPETAQKIIAKRRANGRAWCTEEHKRKLSIANTGHKPTEETLKKREEYII